MMLEYAIIRSALEVAKRDALRVYEANRDAGSPVASVSYDSGRYAGLGEAIEILDKIYDRS